MTKLHSFAALSCALWFTSAQAPTFELWGSATVPQLTVAIEASSDSSRLRARVAGTSSARQQALDESDRFHLDQFNLPQLNVDLPALFEWSNDPEYLVDERTFGDAAPGDLVTPSAQPLRTAMWNGGGGRSRTPGVIGADTQVSSSNVEGSDGAAAKGSFDERPIEIIAIVPNESLVETIQGNAPDPVLLADIAGERRRHEHIEEEAPVDLPLPASVWLFALGLVGLQVASRRRK